MRLINTESLQFEEVVSHEMVKYAILSHTWGEEEVSLQDFQDISIAREKKGFSKIEKTCELARLRNIKYAWVDTCCIDKTSSAELSEAINSMYRWYHDAEICFAYLSDMPVGDVPIGNEGSEALSAAFRACKWFTRGWTAGAGRAQNSRILQLGLVGIRHQGISGFAYRRHHTDTKGHP